MLQEEWPMLLIKIICIIWRQPEIIIKAKLEDKRCRWRRDRFQILLINMEWWGHRWIQSIRIRDKTFLLKLRINNILQWSHNKLNYSPSSLLPNPWFLKLFNPDSCEEDTTKTSDHYLTFSQTISILKQIWYQNSHFILRREMINFSSSFLQPITMFFKENRISCWRIQ